MCVNRREVTRSLSDMVEARLSGKTYWASEVMIGALDARSPRVDYMSFHLDTRDYGRITAAAMERGVFACYEVKSCMADLSQQAENRACEGVRTLPGGGKAPHN